MLQKVKQSKGQFYRGLHTIVFFVIEQSEKDRFTGMGIYIGTKIQKKLLIKDRFTEGFINVYAFV